MITPVVARPQSLISSPLMAPTLSDGPSIVDTFRSVAVCGAATGAPSLLGAAFGLPGAVVGLAGVGAMAYFGSGEGEREILVPLSLMVGAVAGVAGAALGWPGAVIATGVGLAYGMLCA